MVRVLFSFTLCLAALLLRALGVRVPTRRLRHARGFGLAVERFGEWASSIPWWVEAARPARACIRVESLEPRLVLATRTWLGAIDALWSNPGNWLENTVPGAGDSAVFTQTSPAPSLVDAAFAGPIHQLFLPAGYTGSLTLNQVLTVTDKLSVSGGTLTINSGVTLSAQNVELVGGVLLGPGTLDVGGIAGAANGRMQVSGGELSGVEVVIATTGALDIFNDFTLSNGAALTNYGNAGWVDGIISLENSVITNRGTFELLCNSMITGDPPSRFDNQGLLWKTSNGISIIGVLFNNKTPPGLVADVLVSAGTLQVIAGGEHNSTFTAAAPGQIEFKSAGLFPEHDVQTLDTGTVFRGAGPIFVSGRVTLQLLNAATVIGVTGHLVLDTDQFGQGVLAGGGVLDVDFGGRFDHAC
jgi:hypothetical protein